MKVALWKHIRFVALGVAVLAVSEVTHARIPDSDGVINSCYKKTSPNQGSLRVIDTEKGQSCSANENSLPWEQTAPTTPGSLVVQQADAESFLLPDNLVSRATVSITVPQAGSVLVNAWTTIVPLGIQGEAAVRLRDVDTDEASTLQVVGYMTDRTPISIGWLFNVAAGEHTYSLDVSLTANIISIANKTLTALYVPSGGN